MKAEKCVWKVFQHSLSTKCGKKKIAEGNIKYFVDSFILCPYCGREIEVRDES